MGRGRRRKKGKATERRTGCGEFDVGGRDSFKVLEGIEKLNGDESSRSRSSRDESGGGHDIPRPDPDIRLYSRHATHLVQ